MKKFFFKIGILILLAFVFSILSIGIDSIQWDVIGTECPSNENRPEPYDHFCWEPVTVYGYPLPYIYPDISSSVTSTIEFKPFIYDIFFYFMLFYTMGGLFLELKGANVNYPKGTRPD